MRRYDLIACGLLLALFAMAAEASEFLPRDSGFEDLGSYKAPGEVAAQIVGPGPTAGSERIYVSYMYVGGTGEVVSIDPATGEYDTYTYSGKKTAGAWALKAGPDGKIYIGTVATAELYRIDPVARKLEYIGRPNPAEAYIWDIDVGADGKIYGGTSPHAGLVRYDPNSGALEDLGRMHPTEMFARYVAGDAEGFVYTIVGLAHYDLVAYEISTGRHRDILPPEYRGWRLSVAHRMRDGKVYTLLTKPGTTKLQWLRLDGWKAVPVSVESVEKVKEHEKLRDGRLVTDIVNRAVVLHNPRAIGVERHSYRYPGKPLAIFRLGSGPDGKIYASTVLPLNLIQFDPETGKTVRIDTPSDPLGTGETYSFLASRNLLYMGTYAGYKSASLMAYDPSRPYQPGVAAESNPYVVPPLPQIAGTWRPMAMISAADKIYIGAIAAYGKRTGYLVAVDPATRRMVGAYQPVADQGIASLVSWRGMIVGGTWIISGPGVTSISKDAHLFVWDPATEKTVFDTVPIAHASLINNLAVTPDGMVIGIEWPSIIVFDPATRSIRKKRLPFAEKPIDNSLVQGPGGLFYGLYAKGIFTIDPVTYAVNIRATYAQPVTAGVAVLGNDLYFAAGSHIVKYRMTTAADE